METPRLMIVADLGYAGTDQRLLDVITSLAHLLDDPRVAIQLRAKELTPMELAVLAEQVLQRVPQDAALVLNGHADLAATLGYAGAHWPERDVPGRRPPRPAWQSAAAHSAAGRQRAEDAGMDAAVFGSVFAPGSHPGEAAGLDALRQITADASIPVVAIGGVTPERVAACIEAGAHGVAAVSAILDAPDPAAAAREYLAEIERALRERVA
jgi:thiamine-phosphate diphosphorylase